MKEQNCTESDTIKVVIVEDFKLTRVGLRCALNANPDIDVVAEAEDANEGLKLIERHKPNVVLMDLGLPGMNGIEAMLKVKESLPDVKIIALTSHDRAEEVIAALSSGRCCKRCCFRCLLDRSYGGSTCIEFFAKS